MSTQPKWLHVYDTATDEKVFEGTSRQVSEFTGVSVGHVQNVALKNGTCAKGRYRIIDTGMHPEKQIDASSCSAAIKAWDDFATPIREHFGIPVYRPGKEERR